MRSYTKYFKLRFITNLQYRAAAIAGISTQIFFGLIFAFVYLAFYKSNPNANYPMGWNELITYIWLEQAFYALIYPFEKDEELLNMIKNGNLAYELIRPQNIFIKFYIKMIAKKVVSSLMRAIPVLTIASLLPKPLNLSLPTTISSLILFLASLTISCLLISSITVLVHILTMYTIDSKGILSIYSVILEVFSGSTIPIPFFPNWLKKIAYILPFRFISDLPFRVYSGSININQGITNIIEAIICTIVTIIIGNLITKNALKKAVLQGG